MVLFAGGVTIGGAVLAFPAPAGAQAPPDTTDALIAVESEVLALVKLGAFPDPVPGKLQDVVADWESSVEGYERADLIDWLHTSDDEGVVELGRLAGSQLSPDTRAALSSLPGDVVRAVESGQRIPMPASVYEHALNDLEYRNGRAPVVGAADPAANPGGGPPATAPAPQPTDVAATIAPGTSAPAPATDPPTTTAKRDQDLTDPGIHLDSPPTPIWLIVACIAGGLVVAGGLAWIVLRRRRSTGPLVGSVAELLDAGRRLSSSVEVAEIVAVLADEAQRLTGSDDVGVIVRNDPDGSLTVAGGTGEGVIDLVHAGRGAIGRVLETGAVVRTAGVDPALGPEARALLAVPLVRGGVVAGVVVATRRATQPYGTAELDLLGQLVPIAAAALVAAGRHDDVAELSLTDGLTELGNRRRLDRDLVSALGAGAGTVGFVMVDIDHFKRFNDTNGHVAGDEALREVARVLRSNVRDLDVVYRYGGEEFCVLLPDATPSEAAEVSERLRHAVEATDFTGAESQPGGRLTISVGTTVASRTDPTEVKERADHALYEAKHQGRNRVVLDEPGPIGDSGEA
jgi:diguanylate cyclase (GGDEF)-like protein